MSRRILITAVCGGFVLFIWGFVSWVVLPWHTIGTQTFEDEQAVVNFIQESAKHSGIYNIPSDPEKLEAGSTVAFMNILKSGFEGSQGAMMLRGLFFSILMAYLALLLLPLRDNDTWFGYSLKFALLGSLIGVAANYPYWNWFGFPASYSLINLVDNIIAWFLAGMLMATIMCRSANKT